MVEAEAVEGGAVEDYVGTFAAEAGPFVPVHVEGHGD